MIVTVWWEDSRQTVRPKLYGPDQLLAACVADDLGCTFKQAERPLHGHPKNGVGNLMRCLREDAPFFQLGPLCAVFDRDRILDLWQGPERPAACRSAISAAIRKDAPGNYGLVLLFDNMETLVAAACRALGRPSQPPKAPTERDRVLQMLAFEGDAVQRGHVRHEVDGFGRLVTWTASAVKRAL